MLGEAVLHQNLTVLPVRMRSMSWNQQKHCMADGSADYEQHHAVKCRAKGQVLWHVHRWSLVEEYLREQNLSK